MPFPHPSPPADAPTRSTPGAALGMLGALVVGCVVTWWICLANTTTVRSESELGSVEFGFPLRWMTQDHSQSPYVDYPQEVALGLGGKSGLGQVPTEYNWLAFLGDALVWGGAAWLLGFVALPMVFRLLRRK